MNKLLTSFCFVLTLTACGDDVRRANRGDAALQLSESWYSFQARCGAQGYDECVKHNVFHFCEIDDTCEDDFFSENLDACTEAIDAMRADQTEDTLQDCVYAYWGITPDECVSFWEDWEAEPEDEE